MTPFQEKILILAKKGGKDPELFLLKEIETLKEEIKKLNEEFLKKTEKMMSSFPDLNKVLESVKGKDGIRGIRGEKGEKGDKGEKGEKGDVGSKGKDGINGKDGRNGENGKDGTNGKDGVNGKDGINGKNGEITKIDEEKMITSILKKMPQGRMNYGISGGALGRIHYFDLTSQCDGVTMTFNVPMNFGIIGVFSTQAPINYRPVVDWTAGNKTITLTNQVSAPATGQTLWIAYVY